VQDKRFVKPAREGLVVRHPRNGRPLPDEGDWVEWNRYWARRLAEESVVKAEPPKKPKAKPVAPAADEKEAD